MSTSVEILLHDAVEALLRSGEEEAAAALARLIAGPAVHLELSRPTEIAVLADEIFACASLSALHALLPRVAAALRVTHCTIHCVRESGAKIYRAKVLTTYPNAWAEEYVGRRYSLIDPVMLRCQEKPGTFFWDELTSTDPRSAAFMEAAAGHGVGPSGITFVSDNAHGNVVAVSLASTEGPSTFRRVFRSRLSDFDDIAALMIEVFAELAGEHDRPTFSPTDDQLKVLRAWVSGLSMPEIGRAFSDHASFATVQSSILATFGAETLTQAAIFATRAGLLDRVPYLKEDIYAPEP